MSDAERDTAQEPFQYPLCRIDGVNIYRELVESELVRFQYPLCRIDGVNR